MIGSGFGRTGNYAMDGVFRAHHGHILSSDYVSSRSDERGDRSRASEFDFVGGGANPRSALVLKAIYVRRLEKQRLRSSQK
jgi:hypothetical protein